MIPAASVGIQLLDRSGVAVVSSIKEIQNKLEEDISQMCVQMRRPNCLPSDGGGMPQTYRSVAAEQSKRKAKHRSLRDDRPPSCRKRRQCRLSPPPQDEASAYRPTSPKIECDIVRSSKRNDFFIRIVLVCHGIKSGIGTAIVLSITNDVAAI